MGGDHIFLIDYKPAAFVFCHSIITVLGILHVTSVEKTMFCLLDHTSTEKLKASSCLKSSQAFLILYFVQLISPYIVGGYSKIRILWRLRNDPLPATQTNAEQAIREKKKLFTDVYFYLLNICDAFIAMYMPEYENHTGGGIPENYYKICSIQGFKFVLSVLYIILLNVLF